MFENWHWEYMWGIAVFINYMFWIIKSLFDGDAQVSTEQQVTEQTAEQAMTLNQAKKVNAANDSRFALARSEEHTSELQSH